MAVVSPPLEPMLGKLARELPEGGFLYEPKWDGFRCLAFKAGKNVDLRSRNDRRLGRYFPEIVDAVALLEPAELVLDGEILVRGEGIFDFGALMTRLHPAASRVERLRLETPASLIAFDLLAVGREDLRDRPFGERRERLAEVLPGSGPVQLTPLTDDPDAARGWLESFTSAGVDGVIAKHRELRYQAGRRAMVKVKRERTADCVVGGFRWFPDRPALSSLLLGLHDASGRLEHVGVVTQLSEARRAELLGELAPLATSLAGHPWEHGFLREGGPTGRLLGSAGSWRPEEMELDWVPLAPKLVCEVAYEHVEERRFRYPARFRRWRPDREPRSCTFEQLESAPADPAELLATAR